MKGLILFLGVVCALIPVTVSAGDTYSVSIRVVGTDSAGDYHFIGCTTQVNTSAPYYCSDSTSGVQAGVVHGYSYHRCTQADRPLLCSRYVGRYITWVRNPGTATATCHVDELFTEPGLPIICELSTP